MVRKKLSSYLLLICFSLSISIFSIVDILNNDKDISEIENRTLTQKPIFNLQNFISGTYSKDYEEYINDQFVLRDDFVTLKSMTENIINKSENNNIVYGMNNHLFEKNTDLDIERLNNNINSIVKFQEKYNLNLDFMIIPSSYSIYHECVPAGLKLVDELSNINEIYNKVNDKVNCVDITGVLLNNKKSYLYYNTDHHWTTFGAYLAYASYSLNKDIMPIDLGKLSIRRINNFYGSYYSKSKYYKALADVITYFPVDNITVNIDGVEHNTIYDYEKFNETDKYAAFLWGNNGLTEIINNEISPLRKGSSILIFKDSFANSFIPYLIHDYEKITVIDLRHYKGSIAEFMAKNQFKDVLIMYNFVNLSSDINITRLKF